MDNNESKQVRKHIHNVRNPLNSISLHAEWGKLLLQEKAESEELEKIFTVILEQCQQCDRVLGEIRDLTTAQD